METGFRKRSCLNNNELPHLIAVSRRGAMSNAASVSPPAGGRGSFCCKTAAIELARLLLFFLARSEGRLPACRRALLARGRCDDLDLFLFRLFGFSIALGHAALPLLTMRAWAVPK